jgi:hypothetical protein
MLIKINLNIFKFSPIVAQRSPIVSIIHIQENVKMSLVIIKLLIALASYYD